MTKKYFWDDPYATSHQTVVSAVDGGEIELGSTIYFAFSGGQEGDQGTIGGIPVFSARKEGLHIKYTLPADHGLQVDQPVEVNIDWTRRYRLMRLHFAAELVLKLFYKKLNGVDKVVPISPKKRLESTSPGQKALRRSSLTLLRKRTRSSPRIWPFKPVLMIFRLNEDTGKSRGFPACRVAVRTSARLRRSARPCLRETTSAKARSEWISFWVRSDITIPQVLSFPST
jgi:hypothetical protein